MAQQALEQKKEKFYGLLDQHYESRRRQKPMAADNYQTTIQEIRDARGKKGPKPSHEKHLLQRFEVVIVGESSRLVLKKDLEKEGARQQMVYVPTYEQLFELVHQAHLACGHGGIHNTSKSVVGWDVPRSAVEVYLKCCEGCAVKVS